MKGMKGKIMKKLKAANKPIGYLNPDRILQQVSNLDDFVDNLKLKSNFVDKFNFKSHPKSHSSAQTNSKPKKVKKVELDELIRDIEVETKEQEVEEIDKENVHPNSCLKDEFLEENDDLLEVDVDSFRRPDMESGSLFDPNLLAAFRYAVSKYMRECEEAKVAQEKICGEKHKFSYFQPEEKPNPLKESEDQPNPLLEFDEKCPPGGTDSVIFYTTTLRGIRKTFEDCQSIRFLLGSFGVIYYERDVSIHSEYRDELWSVMGERVLPPRLFIRGRYIGGAVRVLTLHEQGKLRALFRDIPIDFSEGPCNVCCGLRFMLCYNCNGSRKVFENDDQDGSSNGGVWAKCLQCNENGLVVCPLC